MNACICFVLMPLYYSIITGVVQTVVQKGSKRKKIKLNAEQAAEAVRMSSAMSDLGRQSKEVSNALSLDGNAEGVTDLTSLDEETKLVSQHPSFLPP